MTLLGIQTLPGRKLFLRLPSSNTDISIEKASVKIFWDDRTMLYGETRPRSGSVHFNKSRSGLAKYVNTLRTIKVIGILESED